MPGIPSLPPIVPGRKPISAAAYNRGKHEAELVSRMTGSRGITVSRSAGGVAFVNRLPDRVEMKITSSGTGAHSWEEVYWDGSAYVVDPNGRVGTEDDIPAYERNDNSVDSGSIVEGRLSPDRESYQFTMGGGGGGTSDDCSERSSRASGGVVTNGVGFVPFTWATDQFYFQTSTPGQFRKESGSISSGMYQLNGSATFDVTDCLAVYGCSWAARLSSGATEYIGGMTIPGSPKKTSVTVTGSVGYYVETAVDYFSFWVWYSGTNIVPKATGGYFSIARMCS